MNIKKSINRIFWRFGGNGNKNPFPVNQLDADALNEIIEYVDQKEKQQYEANELFAKLYIYIYQKILENDNSTVMDKEPRMKIYNLLKKPLTQVIDNFKDSLNNSERYELLEELNIDLKHPALQNEERSSNDIENLKEAIKDPEKLNQLAGEVWDYETVSEILQTEINQAINYHR